MQDLSKLAISTDRSELLFHLDYTEQLIDFYVKRKLNPNDLKKEYEIIKKRLKELQLK